MHAPVSVAVSMITLGFFSARKASESARTSRPSASVFRTSDVVPPRCLSTSPGRIADPLGMFSAEGIAAITLIFGLSNAIARIVARIDAAPPMSDFIHSIPVASLIESPPESNAMPLPVSAIGEPFPPPEYLSSISRGGRTLPCPTPSTPPNPPFFSSASVQTLQVSPTCLAIACASFASSAGGRSSAGVFTRSRAHICDSAITSPRRIASFASLTAFASALPAPRTVTLPRRRSASSVLDLYRSNR